MGAGGEILPLDPVLCGSGSMYATISQRGPKRVRASAYGVPTASTASRTRVVSSSARTRREAASMSTACSEAAVRNNLGVALLGVDDERAEREPDAALTAARAFDIRFEIGRVLVEPAGLEVARGDFGRAEEKLAEAREALPDADILERRRAEELQGIVDAARSDPDAKQS